MEIEFVPYNLSFKLKEIGFNKLCLKEFHGDTICSNSTGEEITNEELDTLYGINIVIGAPLWQQAFEWFSTLKDWPIESWIQPYLSERPRQYEPCYWRRGTYVTIGIFDTKYDAQIALLEALIELIENDKENAKTM